MPIWFKEYWHVNSGNLWKEGEDRIIMDLVIPAQARCRFRWRSAKEHSEMDFSLCQATITTE